MKRTLGELVRRGPGDRTGRHRTGAGPEGFAAEPDPIRADAAAELVRLILAAPAG